MTKRRSIRAFRTDPVPSEKVDAIIAAGQHAPSGAQRHSWRIQTITDSAVKKVIKEKCQTGDKDWHEKADKKLQQWLKAKHITPDKRFLTDAPVLIAVFGDTRAPYWLESVWICIGYMMLAAVDQGLGTVIYTPGDKSFINGILNVPKHYEPQAILPIGYPLVEPQSNPKKQTEMEYLALKERKSIMSEEKQTIEKSKTTSYNSTDKSLSPTCACGCGRRIVRLSSLRKYIQGHAKFGVNGLHKVLKSPPTCRCGCGLPTEWDWENMNWKKYIDSHIGLKKLKKRKPLYSKRQLDLFKPKLPLIFHQKQDLT